MQYLGMAICKLFLEVSRQSLVELDNPSPMPAHTYDILASTVLVFILTDPVC